MTDHVGNDVLKELDAALRVEPSRAFADGVRARIDRSRTNTARMWWGLAAAASIGLATLAVWRPATGSAPNDAPVQVAVAPAPATAPTVPARAPEGVVAMAPAAPGVPPAVTRRQATVARAPETAMASEPRLEVITNQGAVLRQLWADYQGRPLVLSESESVVEELSTKPIEVDPIVVRPIVVSEMGKEPGPAGATPVIRRVEATKETK